MPLVAATRAKQGPNLQSLSRMRYFGVCPYGVASRRGSAVQASVGARVTPTCITLRDLSEGVEERKERAEKEVSHLEEIASPNFSCMIAEKGSPVLSPLIEAGAHTACTFGLCGRHTRISSLSNSPRIRSAPQSRLSLAISLSNAMV